MSAPAKDPATMSPEALARELDRLTEGADTEGVVVDVSLLRAIARTLRETQAHEAGRCKGGQP